ncbi:MAG: phosphoribosylamine--glycine ligase [Myxococcales bacterium]|nr:MAG: phosphoribosylamine--glycine ligase [Myxococcales bacterium]
MTSKAKVLVLGSGAREHALVWRLSQSSHVAEVICVPGNAGIAELARTVEMNIDDHASLVNFAKEEKVNLVVVGPEAPLVQGIADVFSAHHIAVVGPSRAAAQLEGSKVYSKEFMRRHGIPTAAFQSFDDPQAAIAYLDSRNEGPVVVKADGLAAGKGVYVASTLSAAKEAVQEIMLARRFEQAGDRIVIEEKLDGQEVSFHVLSDGKSFVPLAAAQDHKTLLDGDNGPNTGGMGAYSPPPIVDAALEEQILKQVIAPTLEGMRKEGAPFVGVLFVGLMIVEGQPQVLEYNVRFGDPETEVLMMRLKSDLYHLLRAVPEQGLSEQKLVWGAPAALSVVLASEGYPRVYTKGRTISGLQAAEDSPQIKVFHAGTGKNNAEFVTAAGRVLAVSASGESIDEAAKRAYDAIAKIDFEGKQFRRDIAYRARTHAVS